MYISSDNPEDLKVCCSVFTQKQKSFKSQKADVFTFINQLFHAID